MGKRVLPMTAPKLKIKTGQSFLNFGIKVINKSKIIKLTKASSIFIVITEENIIQTFSLSLRQREIFLVAERLKP